MNPFTPYLLPIKLAAGTVLCALLVKGGCAWQAKLDEATIAKAQARITSLETSLSDHVALYDRMNAKAKQDKVEADAQKALAEQAVQMAERDERDYRSRLALLQADLERAKRDPKCREQLEARLCVVLR